MRLPKIPSLESEATFDYLVQQLSIFFVSAIDAPHEWEELIRDVYPTLLKPLVRYLVDDVSHPELVCALLALRWHFGVLEDEDDRGVNETRGLACELVAWRFVTRLTRRETIDCLCHDLPADGRTATQGDVETGDGDVDGDARETSPLLGTAPQEMDDSYYFENPRQADYAKKANFTTIFAGLNALEIAAVAEAKKFLAQKSVQHIIDGIWTGDIVFWETLSTHSTKQAKAYRKDHSDPFCRLRVPLYLKVLEVVFFAAFLGFYYAVLVQRPVDHITVPEVMLYVWLVSFTYNEVVEFLDAGSAFYATDFWALWDVGIILVGLAFFLTRMIGLANNDHYATDVAFDILSVEALFLVPRICSPLSLHPYFGMLLPVLKEMTKDFLKFAVLVVVAYTGFSSCFSVLGRDHYSFGGMNWILVKVFFGSSYLGFDVAEEISPTLGPPLMFIFIAMTNFLLLTVLISLLSNKLDKVMLNARGEFLMVYSIYVLEASTSNRLTYFVPPLNLLPLFLRPLRLALSHQQLRMLRISILKVTHLPIVGLILGWENGRLWMRDRPSAEKMGGSKRLSKRLSRKALVYPPSLAQETPSAAAVPARDRSAASETIEELGSAVNDLKKQVEFLSRLLLAKQSEVTESL